MIHGAIQKRLARCTPGSRRHRKLTLAKKRSQALTDRRLRDFDHQVARKAADTIISAGAGRVVVGDVRGMSRRPRPAVLRTATNATWPTRPSVS